MKRRNFLHRLGAGLAALAATPFAKPPVRAAGVDLGAGQSRSAFYVRTVLGVNRNQDCYAPGRVLPAGLFRDKVGQTVPVYAQTPFLSKAEASGGTMTVVAVQENRVYAELRLADNEAGSTLRKLLERDQVPVMAGRGRVSDGVVQPDYELDHYFMTPEHNASFRTDVVPHLRS